MQDNLPEIDLDASRAGGNEANEIMVNVIGSNTYSVDWRIHSAARGNTSSAGEIVVVSEEAAKIVRLRSLLLRTI